MLLVTVGSRLANTVRRPVARKMPRGEDSEVKGGTDNRLHNGEQNTGCFPDYSLRYSSISFLSFSIFITPSNLFSSLFLPSHPNFPLFPPFSSPLPPNSPSAFTFLTHRPPIMIISSFLPPLRHLLPFLSILPSVYILLLTSLFSLCAKCPPSSLSL